MSFSKAVVFLAIATLALCTEYRESARAAFSKAVDPVEDALFNFASPGAPPRAARPNSALPLMRLSDAALVLSAYLFMVVACRLTATSRAEGAEGEKKPDGALLKGAMRAYNVMQCALCGYMVFGAVREAFFVKSYSLVCNSFSFSETGMAWWTYVFYLSKFLDLLDTVWICVKENWKQLSFLHVYHHISILTFYCLNANVGFDGDVYLTIVLNGTVHFVMYYYYLVTSFGAKPWWKKYVTKMQMVQFVMMNAQAVYLLLNPDSCPYPAMIMKLYLPYILSLLVLFGMFFNSSYKKPASKPETKTNNNGQSKPNKKKGRSKKED